MSKQYPTTAELIRAEIERLHRKGGGDWQSLLSQSAASYQPIQYNLAQMLALHIPASVKQLDLEWGRGTGKTTVFATFARRIAMEMPRGSFQWVVPTYQKFLTEIIPAFIHALEMQGLHKDLHYFIGRRPPAKWGWPEPYKPPLKYDNFITFWTGFGFHLLSQDVPGAGRGLSTDGEFADEAAMLSLRKMDEDSSPSIRGSNIRAFGNKRWFDFRLKASSTPLTEEGAWFIERQEMAMLHPDFHQFHRANCLCNMHNLKPDYLEEARRTATDFETFEAEYLNIRPRFTRGGFYALLDEGRHTYRNTWKGDLNFSPGAVADCRGDADVVPTEPLVLGMDFGAAINSLTVSQSLPGEFRTVRNFFAKGADGLTQDDVLEAFHRHFAPHQSTRNEIWYMHDATGNNATGNTKLTKAKQAEAWLLEKGWKVRRMSVTGTNPRHFEKYILWERMLEEKHPRLPRFRINRDNAKETYISMSRAKQKRGLNSEIKKDKAGERSDNPRREHATDLSDALDYAVFMLFAERLKDWGAALPG